MKTALYYFVLTEQKVVYNKLVEGSEEKYTVQYKIQSKFFKWKKIYENLPFHCSLIIFPKGTGTLSQLFSQTRLV